MGSAIACHFANIGCAVLLLDIAPRELNDEEKAKGLSLDDPRVKNRIVQSSFDRSIKSSPGPLFSKKFASRISLGNFSDDMPKIKDYDWPKRIPLSRYGQMRRPARPLSPGWANCTSKSLSTA